jgi:uncharacterized protein (TIGR03067 family)
MLALLIGLSVHLQPSAPADADVLGKDIPVAEFQGWWQLVGIERDGKVTPHPVDQPRWIIKGNNIWYAGEIMASFQPDPRASPRIIDFSWKNPKRELEGIYVRKDDELRICINVAADGGKDRPVDFTTKDKANYRLYVFKKVKGKAAEDPMGTGYIGVMVAAEGKDRVRVMDMLEGSPARKAGLKKDDRIVQVGAAKVEGLVEFVKLIRDARPGTEMTFHIERDGKPMTITFKVVTLPFQLD